CVRDAHRRDRAGRHTGGAAPDERRRGLLPRGGCAVTVLAISGQELVQQIINGLSLGSTYALLALGLAMVFSIMGLINFAHGELVTIGGYTMWVLFDHGVAWWGVIPLTLLATSLAAVAMERVAFRPLRGGSVVTLPVTAFA